MVIKMDAERFIACCNSNSLIDEKSKTILNSIDVSLKWCCINHARLISE